MTQQKIVDYIIVGQGLAGSAVAVQLLSRGRKILVIDQPLRNNSSRIAAGLFNPITGKKMVKTWLADTVFPHLRQFYTAVEQRTGQRFFYPKALYRPFISIEEQNEWMGRSVEADFKDYVANVFTTSAMASVHDPFGGLLLKQCGYLDTAEYVRSVREWIAKDATFIEEDWDESLLTVEQEGVSYRNWKANKIIFCQGSTLSKWFRWLPIKPLKGETLTISTSADFEFVVNRGVYIVPTGNAHAYRVGATYYFNDLEDGITEKARLELEEKLQALVSMPYTVQEQQWGFRPTTPDRRPIMGQHPEFKSLVVFSGLGTKGVSLTPYFSEVLIRSLENNGTINSEADVNRYKSLYWSLPKII